MMNWSLLEVAVAQRDLADLEAHAARLQRADQRAVVDVGVLLVLGAFHQEVDALGMGDHHDLGVGRDVQVVADVAQALGRLRLGVVDVVDDLVLREGGGGEQREGGRRRTGGRNGTSESPDRQAGSARSAPYRSRRGFASGNITNCLCDDGLARPVGHAPKSRSAPLHLADAPRPRPPHPRPSRRLGRPGPGPRAGRRRPVHPLLRARRHRRLGAIAQPRPARFLDAGRCGRRHRRPGPGQRRRASTPRARSAGASASRGCPTWWVAACSATG